MDILDDPNRRFFVSDFLRLEVLPKPTYRQDNEEVAFMKTVLDAAEHISVSDRLTARALELAETYGLTALDALHIGSALEAGVDEFVTLEKRKRAMFRITGLPLRVTSLLTDP